MAMTFPINYSHMEKENITKFNLDMKRKEKWQKRVPTNNMNIQQIAENLCLHLNYTKKSSRKICKLKLNLKL